GILQMLRYEGRLGHDGRLVEKWIADIAIDADSGARDEGVPAFAIVFPRDILLEQRIGDRSHRRRWDGEGLARMKAAVTLITRIVIVEQVVVTLHAVRFGFIGEQSEIGQDRADAGLRWIGAVAVGAAAVAVVNVPII